MIKHEVCIFTVLKDRILAAANLEKALADFSDAVKRHCGGLSADSLNQATYDLAGIMERLADAYDETKRYDKAHGLIGNAAKKTTAAKRSRKVGA